MPPSSLTDILKTLTQEESFALKAEALASLISTGTFTRGNRTVSIARFTTWTLNGITVTVTGARYDGKTLWIAATASDANGPLPAPDRNEYGFVNPPLMVRESETSAREDIVAVAQGWITDAVVAYALNHGWFSG